MINIAGAEGVTIVYTVRNKRVITINGRKVDLGIWTLSDFIVPRSYAAIAVTSHALYRIAENAHELFAYARTFGLDTLLVRLAWDIVASSIRYRGDNDLFNVADWWQHPNETWERRRGDCEDTTFLMQSVIEHILDTFGPPDDPTQTSYAVIGLVNEDDGNIYGHAFVIYKNYEIAPTWLWIETTLEKTPPLSIWLAWDPQKLIPVYWFNSSEMYRIDRDYAKLGLTEDYVKKHEKHINAMIEYVEAGQKTPFKWMHKDKRTPTIDEKHIVQLY